MRTPILRAVSGAAFALSLVGTMGALPASADTALVVGKANSEAESIMTVNVGYDAGIFKKHGLDLKIEDFNGGGSRVVQALTAGSIDIAIGAGTQMSFVAKGAPMIAVCESTTTLPYFSIGVPWDSPIHNVDQLKGKKIGISNPGTLTDWVAQELARKKGWGPDGVIRVSVGGGIAASSAAFRAGQIDAYVGGTASFLVEADQKVGRMLVPVSSFVDNMASGTIFASNHLIQTNPDALRAFLAAWIETTKFILANKEATIQSWHKVTGFPISIESQLYEIVKGMYNPSCRFDPESLATLKRSFVQLKQLETEPDMSKLYTEAYLPKSTASGAGH
jgi:ABC-type nitrate/sulfonate/bicarbonate transport system substrate-binding protein